MQSVPSYLAQNTFGIYYFRIAVPHKLRHIIGKRELRQSLRTKNRRIAMSVARRMAVIAENYFRGDTMTQEELDRLLRLSTEIKIKGLNWHPDGNLSIESLEMDPDKEASEIKMLDSLVNKMRSVRADVPLPAAPSKPAGMQLCKLIEEYVTNQTESNRWAEKTLDENRAIYALMVRYFGNVPLSDLTSQAAREFRSALLKLPTNLNKQPRLKDKPLAEIIKRKHRQTLSDSSVNKYIRRASQMLEWAVEEGHAERNGFKKKQIQESKKPNEKRDSLTADDIAVLFNPEVFHAEACKHPHKYFIPLLGLHTGARLNELASLGSREILKTESGIWCLRIRTSKQKSERYRLVPVHSRLIDLGFIEYARKQKGSLFPELHERRDGKGQIVSKWYSRYRRSVGLTETRNKDFHSFRHTVATELAKRGVPTATVSQIIGHAAASGRRATTTETVYIKPHEVEVLKEAIEQLDFSDSLSGVKPYSEVVLHR